MPTRPYNRTLIVTPETFTADVLTRSTFYFDAGEVGTFTARAEKRRRGGAYWCAYSKRGGRLLKVYIGKPADVTLERLLQVTQQLDSKATPTDEVSQHGNTNPSANPPQVTQRYLDTYKPIPNKGGTWNLPQTDLSPEQLRVLNTIALAMIPLYSDRSHIAALVKRGIVCEVTNRPKWERKFWRLTEFGLAFIRKRSVLSDRINAEAESLRTAGLMAW